MTSPEPAPLPEPQNPPPGGSGGSGNQKAMLDQIHQMLRDAESFIDTCETLTGDTINLSGLRRGHKQLTATQAAQLACTRMRGTDSLLNTDLVTDDQHVAYRYSPAAGDTGTTYAEVESFVAMPRLWASAVRALYTSDTTLGRVVYPQGVKRKTIGVVRLVTDHATINPDTEVFYVRGRLDLGDTPVALVRETLLGSAVLAHTGND